MAKPIYVMYRMRPTAAGWELSEEERAELMARNQALHAQAGAKHVIFLDPFWSTERWYFAGVAEFEDMEAFLKFEDLQKAAGVGQYQESEIMLATKLEMDW